MWLSSMAHSIGVVVSEMTSEIITAADSVTANSRNSRPACPPMNKSGMNTATSDTLMVSTVKPTSRAPCSADSGDPVSACTSSARWIRCASFGAFSGPLYHEIAAAMYQAGELIPMKNIIYGLGGRMIAPDEIEAVYRELVGIAETGKVAEACSWLGVRE